PGAYSSTRRQEAHMEAATAPARFTAGDTKMPYDLPIERSTASWGPNISARKDRSVIVLAEDHDIAIVSLRHVLQTGFFQVAGIVSDGKALMRAIRETEPDVVITDVSRMGMNGLETIRLIREFRPEAKIIVLASDMGAGAVSAALKAGVGGYVFLDTAV